MPGTAVAVMTGILRAPRRAALIAIASLVTAASAASFAESYRGLFEWAHEHGLSGVWAAGFPLQVDVFIAVGELALFVALADSWERKSRIGAWSVTVLGLAVSVAGNVGHIAGHSVADRATAAIPPLAAASALAVGLGVLKRVVAGHRAAGPQPSQPEPEQLALTAYRRSIESGQPLSARALAAQHDISRRKAGQLVGSVRAELNGHGS